MNSLFIVNLFDRYICESCIILLRQYASPCHFSASTMRSAPGMRTYIRAVHEVGSTETTRYAKRQAAHKGRGSCRILTQGVNMPRLAAYKPA